MMTAAPMLTAGAGAADRALIGLEALARQFLELEQPGRAAQVLADVDSGAAALRFVVNLCGLEWHLSCQIVRQTEDHAEPVTVPPCGEWVRGILPALFPLVTMLKAATSTSATAPRLLNDVAGGRSWLGFDVEIRGCMALLSAHVTPASDLRCRVPLMDAGCMRNRNEPGPVLH